MTSLYCLYLGRNTVSIYDKSDMTLENHTRERVIEYLRKDEYSIHFLDLVSGDLCFTHHSKTPEGVYIGDDYILEVGNAFKRVLWLYRDDRRYAITYGYRYFKDEHTFSVSCAERVLHYEGIKNSTIRCNLVPLKGGIYVIRNGKITYKLGGYTKVCWRVI